MANRNLKQSEMSRKVYRELLMAIIDNRYEIREFGSIEPSKPHMIIRHDIDISMNAAFEIAKIEQKLGIKAHYFIMLTSPFYNVLNERDKRLLNKIVACGHTIGLHFNTMAYNDFDLETLDEIVDFECKILENILGQSIHVISFHRPSKHILKLDRRIAGRIHTYAPEYFSSIGYCADSGGRWDYGHPFESRVYKERKAMQLLVHPIWWCRNGDYPIDKLTNHIDQHSRELEEELHNHFPKAYI